MSKEEVVNVPTKPDFNAHIRPLLWQLKHQDNPEKSSFWQKVSKSGLEKNDFQFLTKDFGAPYGIENKQDLTLLWRWARAGGSVEHPKWLYSPLPKARNTASDKNTLTDTETVGLADFLLSQLLELPDQNTPFSSWVKKSLQEGTPYDALLRELFTSPNFPANSIDFCTTAFLAENGLPLRLTRLLGTEDNSPLLKDAETLLSEFNLRSYRKLFDTETLEAVSALEHEISEHCESFAPLSLSPDSFMAWKSTSPAYVPLRTPNHHLNFQEEEGDGYFRKGLSLTKNKGSKLLDNLEDITALSFWVKGDCSLELRSEDVSSFISMSQNTLSLHSQKVGSPPEDAFTFPIYSQSTLWNHISLATDVSKANGFTLYLNGKDITPKRRFHFPFPSPSSSLLVRNLTQNPSTLDELKVFTTTLLSPLEQKALFDSSLPQTSFKDQNSALVVQHLNFLKNENFQAYLDKGLNLQTQLQTTLEKGRVACALPKGMNFNLNTGTYFKEAIPFSVSDTSPSELANWMITNASPWLARTTVSWVHEALTGMPMIDYAFPEDTIPENWEEIDQLAAGFIKSGWNLQLLATWIINRQTS